MDAGVGTNSIHLTLLINMHSREMNITRVHRVMHSLKKHEALQSNRWDFT